MLGRGEGQLNVQQAPRLSATPTMASVATNGSLVPLTLPPPLAPLLLLLLLLLLLMLCFLSLPFAGAVTAGARQEQSGSKARRRL